MPEEYDPNTLWVAISEYGEGNLFSVYPKLLAEILCQDDAARVEGDTSEAEKLVLPSDWDYRLGQYFKLVAMQKVLESEETLLNVSRSEDALKLADLSHNSVEKPPENGTSPVEEWAPWKFIEPTKNPNAPPPVCVKITPGPVWDIKKVVKAGYLLSKPPIPVDFIDEQEMRSVYSIIYDVFRYKTVLDQAIDDVTFFADYPQYMEYRQIAWLFLMELARRLWAARPRGEQDGVKHFLRQAGSPFFEMEEAVWNKRVHFAAAIARIRIKNKAFTLSELLPPHLREEKVTACCHKGWITGWINTFKAKKIASLVKRLHDLGYSYSQSRTLFAGEYRFDRVCPRFITLYPLPNVSVGQLELVKDGVIVLQEREFCEGASTLCRVLRANELTGVVAQTHASSPRSSAYLAAQLRELGAVLRAKAPAAPAIPELGKLVVFGAGDKVESYVESLKHLGIEAIVAPQPESDSEASVCVYSEPVYCDTPAIADALDGVVAVLATPPNSYSAVTDPIDLVCGRGGDLAMLEVLTESEISSVGKERVQRILEEQKKTLKVLLSKPQIQLILYETHSALEAENQVQVTRAVAEANRLAREKHGLLKRKTRDPQTPQPSSAKPKEVHTLASVASIDQTISRSDVATIEADESDTLMAASSKIKPLVENQNSFVLRKNPDYSNTRSRPYSTSKTNPIPEANVPDPEVMPRDPDQDNPDVFVPNSDLFEIGKLPMLENGLDMKYILDRDGCYLGLIQRKEITKLDAKFMIKVAEERGLFGGGGPGNTAQRRKKNEPSTTTPRRRRRKGSGFEVERVSAPTYSSIVRASGRRGSAPASYPAGVVVTNQDESHVCAKHVQRQAAAFTIAAAACTCDARHRVQRTRRRNSIDEVPRSPPPCRRPYPVVVHEVQLRKIGSKLAKSYY